MGTKTLSSLTAKMEYLAEGAPVEGLLKSKGRVKYGLNLEIQDLSLLTLETVGLRGELTIFDPAGRRVRRWPVDGDGQRALAFVADRAGLYQLLLEAVPISAESEYRLVLDQILSSKERVNVQSEPSLTSPRLQRLADALLLDPVAALSDFWQEVETEGAPLVEPDPEDPCFMLCTFLWRGAEHIHNVRVHLLYRTAMPNNYTMKRMMGTDLWHTTIRLPSQGRFSYTLLVNTPSGLKPNMDSSPKERLVYFAAAQGDPLNPRGYFEEGGSPYEATSWLELPLAPPQPWIDPRPSALQGTVTRCPFKSGLLQDERFISIYTPPGYSEQTGPYGMLMVFDEQWFLSRVPTATILDNLLADGKIPPLVAVVVGNGPGEARGRQLPCNPLFAQFLAEELFPWVRREYHVTKDPNRVIVAGSSYGGLAATYVALEYPGQFGNVLSLSGSFWWRPRRSSGTGDSHDFPDQPYLAALVMGRPRLKLQFYLAAGTGEIDLTGKGRSILWTNRHLRDVLLAKGYPVQYQEFVGGHDFLSWRGGLAEGLIRLIASWDGVVQT